MRNIIGARDLAHWLAQLITPSDRLALLVVGQLRLAPKLDTAILGAGPSLGGACADKLFLELGQPA